MRTADMLGACRRFLLAATVLHALAPYQQLPGEMGHRPRAGAYSKAAAPVLR